MHRDHKQYGVPLCEWRKRRQYVFARDGYRCLKCGTFEGLTVDHVRALSNGGTSDASNLQTLCESCNHAKSDRTIDYRSPACNALAVMMGETI